MIKIRHANLNDKEQIVNIWAAGWRYAYKNIFSVDLLNKSTHVDVIKNRIKTFDNFFNRSINVGNVILVATDNDTVIGYASGGTPESAECTQDSELGGLYLNPDYIGHGAGKLLIQAFAKEMQQRAFKTFGLMCFSDNPSMGFYKHMGGIIKLERNSTDYYEGVPESFIEFNISDVLSK